MSSQKVFQVSELTYAIKSYIEPAFRMICVQGEISNFKRQSSGHLYFSLKDNQAQISAAFFKNSASKLTRMPKEGDQVIVKGEISVYPPRGNYQLIIRELQFVGIGELLMKLQQLKETLKQRGWFELEKKQRLPFLPKTIGVITSPTGAVIQDVIHVLSRRYPNARVLLNPVKVQGEGAAEEIAQAINDCNKHSLADVLIIGRGGGSIEDLWAFNEEIVAKAIFDSKIPIISAVGHETDYCIADLVADIRAPTPSAAAEIVIPEKTQIEKALNSYQSQIAKTLTNRLQNYQKMLTNFSKSSMFSSSFAITGRYLQQLDDFKFNLDRSTNHFLEKKNTALLSIKKQKQALSPFSQIQLAKQRLSSFSQALDSKMSTLLDTKQQTLKGLKSHLSAIDPKNLLKQGYSLVFDSRNRLISSKNEIEKGQKITIQVSDGKIAASIE